MKRYRREWKRNLIERENPMWNDLAVGLALPPLVVTGGRWTPAQGRGDVFWLDEGIAPPPSQVRF